LIRIVGVLFAMAGVAEGGAAQKVSRTVYVAVLRVLRPAEAAVRRLIVVAARDLVVKPVPLRVMPKGLKISGSASPRVSFRLFDPPQRFGDGAHHVGFGGRKGCPRIRIIDVTVDPRIPLFREVAPIAPVIADDEEPDDSISAARLGRRLAAIQLALQDLPRQARRYARWRARPPQVRRPRMASALRPGSPPGFRKVPAHEVDDILAKCHWLARNVAVADTS
jgi:hypothetical protein